MLKGLTLKRNLEFIVNVGNLAKNTLCTFGLTALVSSTFLRDIYIHKMQSLFFANLILMLIKC